MIPPLSPRSFSALRLALAAGVLSTLAACGGRQNVETRRLTDGSVLIQCRAPLLQCLSNAENVCKGNSYDVLRARDQRDRYGPELGTAQTEVRTSEVIIRCLRGGKPLFGGSDNPLPSESLPPATGAAAAAAPAPAAKARLCVPGGTQACIGPGACEGGQSCLPDGSGFSPCDCGTIGPPTVVPKAESAAPPVTGTGTGTGTATGTGTVTGTGTGSGTGSGHGTGSGSGHRSAPPPAKPIKPGNDSPY